ncbi:MAG: ATP-binding protein [Nitratireductor sp.]
MSQFENLSHIDFEDLSRDIASKSLGLRFSAFGPGPDGGIDGRHSKGHKNIILQSKHYLNSKFSDLTKSMKQESKKISKLSPTEYILFTSASLNVSKHDRIASILNDNLSCPVHIWGREDVEQFLRINPEIEKSHMKLWLSSTAVLERILQSGLESFTHQNKDEIIHELKIYAKNDSFNRSLSILEDQHVLIVSGPPGVGKTTLSRMLSYYYLEQGWQFYAIRTLDDGFSKIDERNPTIFFFDDFLGRIKLDKQSLQNRESQLFMFTRRIRSSKNSRFILTTRAHIFEEARIISDYIDDPRFQISRYVLDVGAYNRRTRAHILFNHLYASNLTRDHFAALMKGNWLKKIIDHKNYNPRSISSSSSEMMDCIDPDKYPQFIHSTLDNPKSIWEKSYRSLDIRSQNLLISIFFADEFGIPIDDLRKIFSSLHRAVCSYYGQSAKPTDFEEALRSLETGFLSISGDIISFINPSVRDFLKSYLVDEELLALLASTAQRAVWANELWLHMREHFSSHAAIIKEFALSFSYFASSIEKKMETSSTDDFSAYFIYNEDLSVAGRLKLLLDWWDASEEAVFLESALKLLKSNDVQITSWRDGKFLPGLFQRLGFFSEEVIPLSEALRNILADKMRGLFEAGMGIDDLVGITEEIYNILDDDVPDPLIESMNNAISFEFDETELAIDHYESEEELLEHIGHLETLALLTDFDATMAKSVVNNKITNMIRTDHDEFIPDTSNVKKGDNSDYSDEDIKSLFSTLM